MENLIKLIKNMIHFDNSHTNSGLTTHTFDPFAVNVRGSKITVPDNMSLPISMRSVSITTSKEY